MESNKHKRTGVVLASGEGSRLKTLSQTLGLPKHLFPIGKTSIIGRLFLEMSQCCHQLICVVRKEHADIFRRELDKLPLQIQLVVKQEKGFKGDFLAILQAAENQEVFITVGDLIFPDLEIIHFMEKSESNNDKVILGLDKFGFSTLKFPTIFDFRIVAALLTRKVLQDILDLNPESFKDVIFRFLCYLIKNRVRPALLKTLFNVNTPESYQKVISYFERDQIT